MPPRIADVTGIDGESDISLGSTDYPDTRGLLYHRTGDGTFESVAPDVEITDKSSRGIAPAEVDGDGDVDIRSGRGGDRRRAGESTGYS